MPQDFSRQNLRGRSFKGQDLTGANFSGADIRGTDFCGAQLRGANFSHVQAGLQYKWIIGLILISWLMSGISGFFSAYAGYSISFIFYNPYSYDFYTGFFSLILLTVFWLITFYRGILIGLGTATFAFAGSVSLAVGFFFTGDRDTAFIGAFIGTAVVAGALSIIVIAVAFSLALTVTNITKASIITIAGVISVIVAGVLPLISVGIIAATSATIVAIAGALLSSYIGWRALKGDKKDAWVRSFTIAFAAQMCTSFRDADLTDTNLTNASLKNTDFRNATLTRTLFQKAKLLNNVRPGKTYLYDPKVCEVLVSGQGQEKKFDRQNLRGVNFKEANLQDTSFIGTDLSEANLQDADLSRAKLVQTQLDGTDLTGTTLTGATIEDWGITNHTKLHGVKCEYVFMRLIQKNDLDPNPQRKPDNWEEVFGNGEFGDFIKPIFDTLDLYHSQGIDPRAIAISFKRLAENNPEADLRIVGMEVRGEDKFLLRAKTAIAADKSQLSAEYFATYNQLKAVAEQEIKALIAEKDGRIADLQNMVVTALQRPSFYSNVEQVGFMTNNPGGFSVGGSVGGNVNNVQGDNNRAVQGDNNQAVLGDGNQVTQYNQVGADIKESLTKEDIVKLLAELETLIQGAELPSRTKEEVIEDLSAAKKATDKEEPNKQRALERLGTVAETLEKTSKGVEAGHKIWTTAKPILVKVATWLGAAASSNLLGL
ncbi:MAG: pentapeptide repeat-containing protein [Nostoc sp. DedQUE04]|uniref:pentapeptide repeat-containing protein n=1 Tax=Nostoc sp. DedQUE04 TaxID=3075390 RepID=UPI002AD47456|nr:pentapeptide repeat-containing protein [Nostoc sp. DedQUE04]MDZ8140791.1 pentapeptide repeat-containing protein [Nostoc sp. DedQUE04]